MQAHKPGNFFTMASEDHPAYILFRALRDQGWEWDISGGRHWCSMTKGDAFCSFSLWGQGHFGSRNEHGIYGVGFEDRSGTWSDALPAITKFLQESAEQWKRL
jgi:hypothetical protein